MAFLREGGSEAEDQGDSFGGANLPPWKLDDEQVDVMTELFNVIDRNSDGMITPDEFERFGRALTGRDVTREQATAMLSRADADMDGALNLMEWLAYGRFLARSPDFYVIVDRIRAAIFEMDRREGRLPADAVGAGSFGVSHTTQVHVHDHASAVSSAKPIASVGDSIPSVYGGSSAHVDASMPPHAWKEQSSLVDLGSGIAATPMARKRP